MIGVLMQGNADVYDPRRLRAGVRPAKEAVVAIGADPDASLLFRIRPTRLVWWHGWSSGTVSPE
jgi:hypothetical protein